ncbi:MAG TPA: hypothetical protein VLF66_14090 [Thermoanaerobaculia bacterium]|nr:hypothetical protein [Thermoanaerobaculia bacterium]
MARLSKRSEPGAVRRSLLALRPAISDLFSGYGIDGEDASKILREAVELLVVHCERLEDPRHAFLLMLEESCEAHVEALAAEEGTDGDAPHT